MRKSCATTFSGVAAAVEQSDDALTAADRRADELGAGDQRQLLRGQVAVLDLVGVGEVDARGRDVVELLAGPGRRVGEVDDVQDLGAAEAGDLHGTHPPKQGGHPYSPTVGGDAQGRGGNCASAHILDPSA